MTAAVELTDIEKRFGSLTAVQRLSLTIAEGGFVTLLGPSGCGKTTILRMIAGLLDPTQGDIHIHGRRVNDTPIHRRNLGLVFQNYALFPHKTVFDNVAFGLKYRSHNVPKPQIREKVAAALELVQLPELGQRYPHQLSGGQQQRIALARAVVIEPEVLLLDEPLSALDAKLREEMRVELKRIQQQLGITTLFVTHDQAEALALSDQVVVMSAGRVEQLGPPQDVYDTPATSFVAEFLGASNLLPGRAVTADAEAVAIDVDGIGSVPVPRVRAAGVRAGEPARLVIRAERLLCQPADPPLPAGGNGELTLAGVIDAVDYQGLSVRYFVRVNQHLLQAINLIDQRPFAVGDTVAVRLRPHDCSAL